MGRADPWLRGGQLGHLDRQQGNWGAYPMTPHKWSMSFYVMVRVLLVVAIAAVFVGIKYPTTVHRGETGATGAQGASGQVGADGAKGRAGDTGATGAKGSFWSAK